MYADELALPAPRLTLLSSGQDMPGCAIQLMVGSFRSQWLSQEVGLVLLRYQLIFLKHLLLSSVFWLWMSSFIRGRRGLDVSEIGHSLPSLLLVHHCRKGSGTGTWRLKIDWG